MDIGRFWEKVDKSGNCWLWTAGCMWQGYGVLRLDGKVVRAHRIAWELTNGPIPNGQFVRHSCDNPPCVNPAHLSLGAQADNMNDAAIRGRMPTGDHHWSHRRPELAASFNRNPVRGDNHHGAKITAAIATAIRKAHAQGRSGRSLAREYGVTDVLISNVVRRKTWAWLD